MATSAHNCCVEEVDIDRMGPEDWARVRDIYRAGIETGHATFDTSPPTRQEWDATHLPEPRLVARDRGRLVAWAALGPVSRRCAYRGVAEVSLYVDPRVAGRGVGRRILAALVSASEHHRIWTLEAWIFPENRASLRVHEVCGFRVVGVRERIGEHDGRWRDVLLLERRSPVVGT